MSKPLTCESCRAEKPYLMSCIHTFAPRSTATSVPDVDKREEARELATVLRSLTNNE